ncbi:beclin-1 [Galendromus occidentalis]|uniref:Beclin-1 n=1 Tax=Galendromus occidentalis TaxID=34638 RepID=A0AAJ6QSI8_9ACAR|nr:beclin-1 [Galendromus occidentalis]
MAEASQTTDVSFTCQRCSMPLKLDESFRTVDARLCTEIAAPVVLLKPSSQDEPLVLPEPSTDDDTVCRKLTAPLRVVESENYTVVVGDNVHKEPGKFSQHFEMTARLFDVLTDQSEVEHPLCEECTDTLIDHMEKELSTAESEVKDYKRYLSERSDNDEESIEDLRADLAKLQAEEKELIETLHKVESERAAVFHKRDLLLQDKKRLEEDEKKHFKEYMDLKRQWICASDEKISVENQLAYAQAQLDLLAKTNVFNATFHIWHDGHFGTINGFRLGKLPDIPVDWKEINIAWGQTVLLMNSLAKRLSFSFGKHRLVPFGDRSYIEVVSEKGTEKLPLYHTGGLRFIYDVKFDLGMVAFLECLSQFKQEVEQRNKNFSLPYSMLDGKIRDNNSEKAFSIKYQLNTEEEWTKALKFMLTNLKWAVAYCSASSRDAPS